MSRKFYLTAVSLLGAGSLAGAGIQFLSNWYLARTLGPAAWGQLAALLAATAVLAPLAGFGTHRFLLRVYSEEGAAARRWLKSTSVLTIAASVIVAAIYVGWLNLADSNYQQQNLGLVLLPVLIGHVAFELGALKFQIEGAVFRQSVWQVLVPSVRIATVLVVSQCMGAAFTGMHAAICYAATAAAVIAAGAHLATRIGSNGQATGSARPLAREIGVADVARESWPYAVDGALFILFLQGGIVALEHNAGAAEAGNYSVAVTVLMAAYLVPGVIYQKLLLGRIHHWCVSDSSSLRRAHTLGVGAMLTLGLLGMIVVYGFGAVGIAVLLGHQYEKASATLLVLALCVPLRYVAAPYGALLSTGRFVTLKTKLTTVLVAAATAGIWAVSNPYGAVGVAWFMVAAEACLLLSFFLVVSRSGMLAGGVINNE